jgi:hypothetical protein
MMSNKKTLDGPKERERESEKEEEECRKENKNPKGLGPLRPGTIFFISLNKAARTHAEGQKTY